MRDAARVMEAALERIANLDVLSSNRFDVLSSHRPASALARAALVEFRALPAINTETELAVAKARLAKIAELVDDALPAEYAGNVYVDAEHYRSIQRLARGEEARS